jgi:hypothetical protein
VLPAAAAFESLPDRLDYRIEAADPRPGLVRACRKRVSLGLNFPSFVCPEPVLVDLIVFTQCKNGSKG